MKSFREIVKILVRHLFLNFDFQACVQSWATISHLASFAFLGMKEVAYDTDFEDDNEEEDLDDSDVDKDFTIQDSTASSVDTATSTDDEEREEEEGEDHKKSKIIPVTQGSKRKSPTNNRTVRRKRVRNDVDEVSLF